MPVFQLDARWSGDWGALPLAVEHIEGEAPEGHPELAEAMWGLTATG